MTKTTSTQGIELIPIDLIRVLNPRVRNRRVFKEIVENISALGLKRPITVTRRTHVDGPRYDLVCGQGRLEAYRALGQPHIPAFVIEAGADDCMVMSLVENLARRHHSAIELLQEIQALKQRGYDEAEIARKTALSQTYISAVIRLLVNGEYRLLRSIESGQIPVSVAVEIAQADDAGIQEALRQAYESKLLRGQKLTAAKRLIEQRRRMGKGLGGGSSRGGRREEPVSAAALLRVYREDTDKKRLLIRKANTTRERLLFVIEAMRKLLTDESFVALLRAEGLDVLPKGLAAKVQRVE